MRIVVSFWRAALVAVGLLGTSLAGAADFPAPREADWTASDFRFHTGEVMPALRIHYTTVGSPSGEPVLVLHGTAGSGTGMLNPAFAGELFGPGQPLDATKYFVILPDALGAGKSTKPSDGLRAKFPRYNYDDMVLAQYRLVTEGLGIRHLRLVIGNSMGGMHAWLWGVRYPEFMDALVPMACQPTEMSGRNWMMRRMLIDAVRKDPDWKGGDYVAQPAALRIAAVFFGVATIGGSQAYYKAAPTREKADKLLDDRLAAPFTADANDYLYQWEASGDYNPAPGLDRIRASVLAINSADDERNPPELGIMERELPRIKGARLYLIPGSEETRGHGTTGMARFYKAQLADFLASVSKR
jgi:homoserine O-acetyltransferase